MLQDLVLPVADETRLWAASLPPYAWGRNLRFYGREKLDAQATPLALMGLCGPDNGPSALDTIRPQLFALSNPSRNLSVLDLGNLPGGAFGVSEAVEELLQLGILPVVVGGPAELAAAQAEVYSRRKQSVNVVSVDNRLDFSLEQLESGGSASGYLNALLAPPNPWLFHFANIGYQTYFVDPAVLDWFERKGYDHHRLGRVREHIEETEPVVRDADLLLFHFAALRATEMPDCSGTSPSGFFVEEACRIVRYAAMSDKLGSVGFYGLPENPAPMATLAAAQLIWYFVEGFSRRQQDYPFDPKAFTSFLVDIKSEDLHLHFWKSTRSDRWWVELPKAGGKKQAHRPMVPCSYNDYVQACSGELTIRLARAFSRF